MDLTMSIAAMATQMKQADTMNSINLAMLDKVMDVSETQVATLLEGMEQSSVIGDIGQELNILA